MTETTQPRELTAKERECHEMLLKKYYQLLREGKTAEAEQVLKAAETVLDVRGL